MAVCSYRVTTHGSAKPGGVSGAVCLLVQHITTDIHVLCLCTEYYRAGTSLFRTNVRCNHPDLHFQFRDRIWNFYCLQI